MLSHQAASKNRPNSEPLSYFVCICLTCVKISRTRGTRPPRVTQAALMNAGQISLDLTEPKSVHKGGKQAVAQPGSALSALHPPRWWTSRYTSHQVGSRGASLGPQAGVRESSLLWSQLGSTGLLFCHIMRWACLNGSIQHRSVSAPDLTLLPAPSRDSRTDQWREGFNSFRRTSPAFNVTAPTHL